MSQPVSENRVRRGSSSWRARRRGAHQTQESTRSHDRNDLSASAQLPEVGSSGRARRHHGHRGRTRRGALTSSNDRSALQPVSEPVIENTAQLSGSNSILEHQSSSAPMGRNRGGSDVGARGQVSGRTGHRERQRGVVTTAANGRSFGGRLTVNQQRDYAASGEPTSSATVRLRAEASEFAPGAAAGHEFVIRVKHASSKKAKMPRRASLSTAPDITTRIHQDIDHNVYECSICTNDISRRDKVWSCHTCWTVFHLTCVKKWAIRSIATQAASANSSDLEDSQPRTWRCPGCNLPTGVMPTVTQCWCEKEFDPPSLGGLPPFSCGQTCARARDRACPHSCSAVCHAGPCQPCTQMGPTQLCFCGRESQARLCIETDYDKGWSCGQVCNEIMACGEHFCGRPCHEGLCGPCEVPILALCHCGKVSQTITCSMRGGAKKSRQLQVKIHDEAMMSVWTELFTCKNVCNRLFDCEKHRCKRACHTQDDEIPHCPRSPDVVSTCPCGNTALGEISSRIRTSCEDEIPLCNKPCSQKMKCGHACQKICHTGDCFPCLSRIEISCQCGRITVQAMCQQDHIEPPMCMRVCRARLNCGRHECGLHCCTGERKAANRVAAKKKVGRLLLSATRLDTEQEFEAEHICTRVCGRMLKCGSHACQELCHRGPCKRCPEAIFDEVSCNCGRTVLQPPLPCGSQPPPCLFECSRSKACGHPQVAHNCHGDDESCPKCPFLTTKPCLCGKHRLKNQPCWLNSVRCGDICNQKLKCGYHKCRKSCHTPGECEDVSVSCSQPCGKEKSCDHACSAPCHSPVSCKEDKPCEHKIFITCPCQRLKQESRCAVTKGCRGNLDKSLDCNEECLRVERNRKLQSAFNIAADHQDCRTLYAADTIKGYLANPAWAGEQEKLVRTFAICLDQKRMHTKPMKRDQRAFIHSLAEDFGLDHESMDSEPHRHVALFKTPKFVMAPMKMVGDCVRIKQTQSATLALDRPKVKANNIFGDPFNAFLITRVRFGLTVEEVRQAISSIPQVPVGVEIVFLQSEEIVIQLPKSVASPSSEQSKEVQLNQIRSQMGRVLLSQGLGSVELCRVDLLLNIERRESDGLTDGWNQVIKSVPARKMLVSKPLGAKSSFVVLGNQTTRKREKEKKLAVVDDWEMAEEREEAKENEGVDQDV